MPQILIYLLAIAAGFLSGFINTVAGSGSLITLPLLIAIGLPANVANGTNRIAILFQNIVATYSFHRRGALDLRGMLWLGLPAFFGAILGAQIAVNLNEATLRQTIGIVMLIMLVIMLIKPERWLDGARRKLERAPSLLQFLLFFGIGVYGGFIQIGVGIFLLFALVLATRYDVVRGNAVKVGIVLLFTLSALVVFIQNGQVEWVIGSVMAVGSMLGAWAGARFAMESRAIWVQRLVIAIVLISALELLGGFAWLARIFTA